MAKRNAMVQRERTNLQLANSFLEARRHRGKQSKVQQTQLTNSQYLNVRYTVFNFECVDYERHGNSTICRGSLQVSKTKPFCSEQAPGIVRMRSMTCRDKFVDTCLSDYSKSLEMRFATTSHRRHCATAVKHLHESHVPCPVHCTLYGQIYVPVSQAFKVSHSGLRS